MTTNTYHIPICNIYAKGDYTMELTVGSEHSIANVVLDTGSSTLCIHPQNYQAESDCYLRATAYAQEVNYGIGGWAGPVIISDVKLTGLKQQLNLQTTHFALATVEKQSSFAAADGIFGLAYHHLNPAFNLSQHLTEQKIEPAVTYPWPFNHDATTFNFKQFKHWLWQQPEQDLQPLFTYLATHHKVDNCFSFVTHRSSIHYSEPTSTDESLKKDPLNNGLFILGKESKSSQTAQTIKVLNDIYYNVHLVGIQVGDGAILKAPALEPQYLRAYATNAIVDSGASALLLPQPLYQALLDAFTKQFPTLAPTLLNYPAFTGVEQGIKAEEVNLSEWPDLHFYFTGIDENPVKVSCPPQNYWQINAPKFGEVSFKIFPQLPNWPNQSLIGLPLMNGYKVTFDRSVNKTGVIEFLKL